MAQVDTVFKKVHYNNVEYYPNKKLRAIGNIKDSLKTGIWIYFKPDGKILAKGEYMNGKKTGKWLYIDYQNKKQVHKWGMNKQPIESFRLEGNRFDITDEIKIIEGQKIMRIEYLNGKMIQCVLY